MTDSWHDRLYSLVPYVGAVLIAVAAGVWWLTPENDGAPTAASSTPGQYSNSSLSLVVVEAHWCGWCKRFRRDVAPKYEDSPYAARVPLRYVQLDSQRNAGLRLASEVRAVPTFVLVNSEGREIDRVRGYPGGPDRFFAALDRMLDRAR